MRFVLRDDGYDLERVSHLGQAGFGQSRTEVFAVRSQLNSHLQNRDTATAQSNENVLFCKTSSKPFRLQKSEIMIYDSAKSKKSVKNLELSNQFV